MLGVDFYRLFHTPLFYIFLVIAAIIPAMVFGSSGMDSTGAAVQLYTNTWQMVASQTPLYVVNDIGEYANMNMVFIFGGIMVSIFIGHDYKSGYVKQLFTTHAKKQDYMMSKALVGAFSMACIILSAVGTGRPSSDTAAAPDSFKASKSVSVSPLREAVIAAAGYTLASASLALSNIQRICSGVSHTGDVLGIHTTDVTPPAAAARQPLWISSLCVWPGSRR